MKSTNIPSHFLHLLPAFDYKSKNKLSNKNQTCQVIFEAMSGDIDYLSSPLTYFAAQVLDLSPYVVKRLMMW